MSAGVEHEQPFHAAGDHESSFWMRQQLQALAASMAAGQVTRCGHLAAYDRPAVTALWKPGLVVCEECQPNRLRLTGEADRTCDRCGHVGPVGVRPGGVRAAQAGGHPLIILFGLCEECTIREGILPETAEGPG